MPWLLSVMVAMFSLETPLKKLGQPVPESNLALEANSGRSQQRQWYVPVFLLSSRVPQNGRSVPLARVTRYCSGVSIAAHSSSVLTTLSTSVGLPMPPLPSSSVTSTWVTLALAESFMGLVSGEGVAAAFLSLAAERVKVRAARTMTPAARSQVFVFMVLAEGFTAAAGAGSVRVANT